MLAHAKHYSYYKLSWMEANDRAVLSRYLHGQELVFSTALQFHFCLVCSLC